MKKVILTCLAVLAFSLGVFAQKFPANPTNPRDVRDEFIGLEFDDDPFKAEFIDMDNKYRLLNEVRFVFPDFSSADGLSGHVIAIGFGDGTPAATVTPGAVISHTYPLNTTAAAFPYTVRITVDGIMTDFFTLNFTRSYSLNGANFSAPNDVFTISPGLTVVPPVTGAFPAGSVYEGSTVGAANLYISYAPEHGGKLVKPLIFVDGIDFNSDKTYTYDGKIVRQGSTGWNVFQFGNTGSKPNTLDNSESEYKEYPAALDDLRQAGYDIVFVDFTRGADWIQRNGEVLIECIKWINAQKTKNREAGVCTFDNAVIGASMGGQVARWALRSMEARNINHETHTYISFDSPQQGANIPIGVQAFILLAAEVKPEQYPRWAALCTPAARQMIINHLLGELQAGRITVEEYQDFSCENINNSGPTYLGSHVSEFTLTNEIREQFSTEMTSLGYPQRTRNAGIACGTATGNGLGIADGASMLDGTVGVDVGVLCPFGSELAFDGQIFSVNGGIAQGRGMVQFCGFSVGGYPPINYPNWHCTGLAGFDNALFKGAMPSDFTDFFGKDSPSLYRYMNVKTAPGTSYANLDSAPGCSRTDLADVGQAILDDLPGGVTANVTIPNFRTCFMPTMSLLDIQLPMNDDNLFENYDLTFLVGSNLTPFDAVWASPAANLRHIEITRGSDPATSIVAFTLQEMEVGFEQSIAQRPDPLVVNSGQKYNYGKKFYNVPNTTVNSGGQLSVNIEGRINFMGPTDPLADKAVFHAMTGAVCGEAALVEVKSGGTLQRGEPGGATKTGVLHVVNNSTVHVFSGGTLQLDDESQLILYAGNTLILDAGAAVQLPNPESKIILRGGTLQVNGEFTFHGQGCFQFENSNAITFGNGNNQFKLVGDAQANRFINIVAGSGLNIPSGGNIWFEKGTIEQNGSINLNGGSTALLKNVDLNGNGTGYLVNGINAGQIRLQFCNVKNCFECIYAEGGTGTTFIMDSHFDNYGLNAVNIVNKPALKVFRSTFDGTAGSGHGLFHAISANEVPLLQLYDSEISNHYSQPLSTGPLPWNVDPTTCSAGLWLNKVSDCIMTGGFIDFCDIGVANLDGTMPSEFFMYGCATIKRCPWGIFMNGDATNGMVTMDGAKIHDCPRPIVGTDLLLNIEATCERNNSFISGFIPGPVQPYFTICYQQKTPPSPIPMRRNHWAYWNSASVTQDPNPASHMAITQNANCNSIVNVTVSPTVSAERFMCDNGTLCWEALSNIGYNEACTIPVTPTTIEGQFNAAYAAYLGEDFETAFSFFEPLSNLAGTGSGAYPTWCKQYVDISRAMVDPTASNHSNKKVGVAAENNLLLRPNPATESIEIGLPDGESHVTITDVFGKKVWENDCNGACYLSVIDWATGIYTVQVFQVGDFRPISEKLMVINP